jgi:hypothetical protein
MERNIIIAKKKKHTKETQLIGARCKGMPLSQMFDQS